MISSNRPRIYSAAAHQCSLDAGTTKNDEKDTLKKYVTEYHFVIFYLRDC